MPQAGDRRIRHLTKPTTLGYIPSNDYGKNGDSILVKSDKSNTLEEFIKQDGRWISLTTGRAGDDAKRRAGKKGTSNSTGTTIQNITVNQTEGTGTGTGTVDHSALDNLSNDDHTQYVHITSARTISASHVLSGNPSFSGNPIFSAVPNFSGIPNFTKADGTNPFTVTSTTKVGNLNADRVDGKQPGTGVGDIAYYDSNNQVVDSADSARFLGQSDTVFFKLADNEDVTGNTMFTGTVALNGGTTGLTPPFTVDSKNEVVDLNAAKLSGKDWDAPLAIGNTNAAAGTFTTLTGTTLDVNGNMTITGTITGDAAASGNLSISSGGSTLIEGTTFTGNNVTIPGNLTVQGETVTFTTTTVQVQDQNIYLAYNNDSGTSETQNAFANAGGMSLKASSDKHFVWYSATNRWTSSEDVESPGLYLKTNTESKISFHDTASDAMSYIGTTNAGDIIFTAPTNQGVTVHNNNHFGGTSFVSGFAGSGWRVSKDSSNEYNAEFDNLIVRGTMSVYELLIQQIRASNGSLIIGSADKVTAVTQVSGARYKFTVEADDSVSFIHFADNDLIIAQKWAGTSGDPPYSPVKRVRATVNETQLSIIHSLTTASYVPQSLNVTHGPNTLIVAGLQVFGDDMPAGTIIATIVNNNNFTLNKFPTGTSDLDGSDLTFKSKLDSDEFEATVETGDTIASSDLPMDFVRIGNTSDADRQGGIYLTSEDSGAPFIDIFDEVDSWADWRLPAKTKARLGKLDGITHNGTALTDYGLFSDRVYLTGNITADSGYIGDASNGWTIASNKIHNGNVHINAQYETIRLGTVVDFTNDDNTKSGILMGKESAGNYDFFMGKENTEYVHWDDSAAKLYIKGDIEVTNSGDFADSNADVTGTALTSGTTISAGGVFVAGNTGKFTVHASDSSVNYDQASSMFIGMSGSPAKPKFSLKGGESDGYIKWDGESLSLSGSITVTGGSGIANLGNLGDLGFTGATDATNDSNTTTIIGNTINTSYINALNVNAATVSASWVYAGSLTAGQIQTSASAFIPDLSYIFRSNAHGFTDFGLDVVNGVSFTTITHTSADAGFRKGGLSFDGLVNRYIKIRFRRQAGSAWDGSLYWQGQATSNESASFRKDFADPTGGTISDQWYVLLLDMWDLTAGGDAWKDDNVITNIRIDFGNGVGDEFDIDFIMLGDVSADTTGTFIDSSGVYTGSLTAGQVNAVSITANTIDMDTATVTGTLAAGNIDVSGIVTATSVNAVAISADSITAGSLTGRTVQTTDGHSKLDDTTGFGNLTPTETQIGSTQYNTSSGSAVPATNPTSLASTTWSTYGTVCFRFDLKCDNVQENGVDYGIAKVQARKKQEGTWSNFGSAKFINFISPDGQWKNYEINYSTTELDNAIVDNILLLITEATAPGYVSGGYGGGGGTATSELRVRYYKHIGIKQKTVINHAGLRTYSTPSNYAKFGSGSNYLKGQTNISGNLSVYGEAFKLTGGSWLSTSDERIKNINGDYSKGLSVIKDIDIVNYEYKHDLGKEYVGVIAQKLEKVLPEAVSEKVSMGYDDLRVVNESPVLWTLVNAVKELSDEVDKIKKKKRCKCGRK